MTQFRRHGQNCHDGWMVKQRFEGQKWDIQNWAWTGPEVMSKPHDMVAWTSRRHLSCVGQLSSACESGCLIREKPLLPADGRTKHLSLVHGWVSIITCTQTENGSQLHCSCLGEAMKPPVRENFPKVKLMVSTSNHLVYMEPEVAWGWNKRLIGSKTAWPDGLPEVTQAAMPASPLLFYNMVHFFILAFAWGQNYLFIHLSPAPVHEFPMMRDSIAFAFLSNT